MKYKNIGCIVLIIFCNRAAAQTQFSGWLADFNTIKINKQLSIHSDIQLRSSDQLEHIQTLLLRGGLNYRINSKFILTGGYAFIHNRRVMNGVSGYINEHRLWEQGIFNHPLVIGSGIHKRKGTLQHRLRLEQRFIPQTSVANNELKKDKSVYAGRLRYFLRNITPLIPWSSVGKAPFLALQNELFINIGDKSGVNGEAFDQNRAYVALGYRFHTSFDMELGYMNQYTNGRGSSSTNNHLLQIATYVRL